jgi:P27 family predicted phage terminase small subunit
MPKKRLPDVVKEARGTLQKCRGTTASVTLLEPAEVPPWLPDQAKRYFRKVRELVRHFGYDSASYSAVIALAAARMYEIEVLTERIEQEGYTVEGRGGVATLHPAVRARNEAQRHLQSLLAEVGLTPSAAGRASSRHDGTELELAGDGPAVSFSML